MPAWGTESRESAKLYGGRWVARLGERIVGQGGTPEQALHAAQSLRFKEKPQVSYVPTAQPLSFAAILEKLAQVLSPEVPIYVVGGAVRDALLGQVSHDIDLLVPVEAISLGRRLANTLHAAFYPLNEEYDSARLLFNQPDGSRYVVDICSFRGPDLESDLRARDFTINAMAVSVHRPQELLDPLGGAADLRAKTLRACSATTFSDDPVRILRAVRQAAAFTLHIQPETRALMRQAVSRLRQVSVERVRDELFRILAGPRPSVCLRALDLLGALPHLLPELSGLKGLQQSPPHVSDVWTHTLATLQKLEILLETLQPDFDPDKAANLTLGLAALRLGRYRQALHEHLSTPLSSDRPLRPLLFLAALYHDVGKAGTQQIEASGRIRYFDHEQASGQLAARRGQALRLSNAEIERLKTVVRHHMRPLHLAQSESQPSRRAIYRFFRDTQAGGIDICLLSLADVLATYGAAPPQAVWGRHLDVVRGLMEAWWEKPAESVAPPALLDGRDLLREFDLPAGPHIGRLLEAVREATASGQISTRAEALALVKQLLEQG